MKTKNIFFFCLGLCWSLVVNAQTKTPATGQELNSTPPTIAETVTSTTPDKPTKTATAFRPGKIQYSFAMGSQFSRFGSAAYFQPGLQYSVSNRFRVFASVNILNTFGPSFGRNTFETGYPGAAGFSRQHYVVQAGGNYTVNSRLNLTGSIWRDFSKQNRLTQEPVNLFSPMGSSGMLFRANYKVTENFSISGGFRYSNGNQFYNPLYQYDNPFGF